MPAAFEIKSLQPQQFTIPDELIYEFMIHRLAKMFCVTPLEAEKMSEKDFWIAAAFEKLTLETNPRQE